MNSGVVAFLTRAARDSTPGRFVELDVEPGKHNRAMWELSCSCKQLCGCRHRAGRASGDHGLIAAGETLHLSLDEKIAPRGGVDRADRKSTRLNSSHLGISY